MTELKNTKISSRKNPVSYRVDGFSKRYNYETTQMNRTVNKVRFDFGCLKIKQIRIMSNVEEKHDCVFETGDMR